MRLAKEDIPVRMVVPGATARQISGFGSATGPLGAEYFSLGAGTDITPLLVGLEGDLCQAPHWGYVIGGQLVVTYADDSTDTCVGGDVFHWPEGHTVRVEKDAEVILFSPPTEHLAVIDHMLARLTRA